MNLNILGHAGLELWITIKFCGTGPDAPANAAKAFITLCCGRQVREDPNAGLKVRAKLILHFRFVRINKPGRDPATRKH